jgi:hypothetical protein
LVTSNALKKGFGAARRATVGIEIGNAVYVLASRSFFIEPMIGGLSFSSWVHAQSAWKQ